MGRIQYEVIPHGERWRVRTAGFGREYGTQLEALFAALFEAKSLWKSLHAPTAVRVQLADGTWREARAFGDDDDPAL
jgi:hypothetical protein